MVKAEALELIKKLPDNKTTSVIMGKLFFKQQVGKGLRKSPTYEPHRRESMHGIWDNANTSQHGDSVSRAIIPLQTPIHVQTETTLAFPTVPLVNSKRHRTPIAHGTGGKERGAWKDLVVRYADSSMVNFTL